MTDSERRISPAMFRAVAKEVQMIVVGVTKSRMRSDQITSRLAGHWSNRILLAAFDADTPHDGRSDQTTKEEQWKSSPPKPADSTYTKPTNGSPQS